jgi:hypothetical protein
MEGETGFTWKLLGDKEYSFGGRGHNGPSLAVTACCHAGSLVNLFLFFFHLQFLQTITQETRD